MQNKKVKKDPCVLANKEHKEYFLNLGNNILENPTLNFTSVDEGLNAFTKVRDKQECSLSLFLFNIVLSNLGEIK